jgi:coproporphyrinogen III oxidase-like Fe-S oxidoreductase
MQTKELIQKYNVPGPRYTSYPTVPFWKSLDMNHETWVSPLESQLKSNASLGIYIHLPFCESLCTFCGCHKRITKNHQVEQPYIETVLREWELYQPYLKDPNQRTTSRRRNTHFFCCGRIGKTYHRNTRKTRLRPRTLRFEF